MVRQRNNAAPHRQHLDGARTGSRVLPRPLRSGSPAFERLRPHPEVCGSDLPDLLERLAQVPVPRDPRGVRHLLVTLVALAACAVLAGVRSLLAVSEWVADAPPALSTARCHSSG
ncbi:transposase family protein [Streptomyces nodosus]